MYYILFYKLIDNYLEARNKFREAHFNHVKTAQLNGEFVMGGAFEDLTEAALIFKADHPSIIEDFAKTDPYVLEGLVTSWKIRRWKVVIGGS